MTPKKTPKKTSQKTPKPPVGSGTTLITVAPTGAEADKERHPALPVTLNELVNTARECEAAGASVIHVHIRDDQARPTLDLTRLKDTVQALRESSTMVVQLSTGGAVTDAFADRLAVLEAQPDGCSLTCGTVNFGDEVFMNPWPFIRELYARTKELRVVPEFELFDLGHIATLHRLLDEMGEPHGGQVHCDLVMGVPGGMPGDAATLVSAVEALPAGFLLVGYRHRAQLAAGDVRRAVGRRAPAGGHGGYDQLHQGPEGGEQRRAGAARGRPGRAFPASADAHLPGARLPRS